MSNEGGPWKGDGSRPGPAPASAPAPEPGRPWLWLVLVAALAGIVVALIRAFPEAVRTPDDWTSVAYGVGVVVLVCSGVARVKRHQIGQHLRHAAIWAAIVAVVALVFAYRQDLGAVPRDLRIAFSGGSPVATGEREMIIPQDESGAFVVIAKVNGERVRFLVDTGATDTVLSPEDASRLGLDVEALSYDRAAMTANGLGYGAAYAAERLEVGEIRIDDFPMTVNKAPMGVSLLGMSFLNRLESFEAGRGRLTLKWREDVAQAGV